MLLGCYLDATWMLLIMIINHSESMRFAYRNEGSGSDNNQPASSDVQWRPRWRLLVVVTSGDVQSKYNYLWPRTTRTGQCVLLHIVSTDVMAATTIVICIRDSSPPSQLAKDMPVNSLFILIPLFLLWISWFVIVSFPFCWFFRAGETFQEYRTIRWNHFQREFQSKIDNNSKYSKR